MKVDTDAGVEAQDKLKNAVSNAFLVLRHNLGNPHFIVRGLTALGREEMTFADARQETYFALLEDLLRKIVGDKCAAVRDFLADRRRGLLGDHSLDIMQNFALKNEAHSAAKAAGCWIASAEDLLLARWKLWQIADDLHKAKLKDDLIVDLRRATDLANFYSVLTEFADVSFLEERRARTDLQTFDPLLADIQGLFTSLLDKNKEASTKRSAHVAGQSLAAAVQEPVFE